MSPVSKTGRRAPASFPLPPSIGSTSSSQESLTQSSSGVIDSDQVSLSSSVLRLVPANQLRSSDTSTSTPTPPAKKGIKRHLEGNQIQFMAMGASIGTALFVGIGPGLQEGGPLALLLAFVAYALLLAPVNNSLAEMATFMPVASSFVGMAGKWVDPALGFAAGWIFFAYEAVLIPFEVSALAAMLQSWAPEGGDGIPIWIPCLACTALWAALNTVGMRFVGAAETGLTAAKLGLMAVVFGFTVCAMSGANPHNEVIGFRYWKDPGALAHHLSTPGGLGIFFALLACLRTASLTIVGPEYVAMLAGEAKRPRVFLKRAFKTVYLRFGLFFVGAALCVGILLPHTDPSLLQQPPRSPFVLAIRRLGVGWLAHAVNGLIVAAIFSAGNGYVFCASRSLHGMAVAGHAPALFARTRGDDRLPHFALAATLLFPLLALAGMLPGGAGLVSQLGDVVASAQIVNYFVMSVTYLCFHRALRAQGVDRASLPYRGALQPFCGWVGAVGMGIVMLAYGYKLFVPGYFAVADLLTCYAMPLLGLGLFVGYKYKLERRRDAAAWWGGNGSLGGAFFGLCVVKRTIMVQADEADLVWDRPLVDKHENTFLDPPERFLEPVIKLFRKKKGGDDGGDLAEKGAEPTGQSQSDSESQTGTDTERQTEAEEESGSNTSASVEKPKKVLDKPVGVQH